MTGGPRLFSILRQGPYLIASIHTALDDAEMVRFQRNLIEQIGQHRARGVRSDGLGDLDATHPVPLTGPDPAEVHGGHRGTGGPCPASPRRPGAPASASTFTIMATHLLPTRSSSRRVGQAGSSRSPLRAGTTG